MPNGVIDFTIHDVLAIADAMLSEACPWDVMLPTVRLLIRRARGIVCLQRISEEAHLCPPMRKHYTLLALAQAIAMAGVAQTTIAPLSVTSTLNSFGTTPNVDNLIGNISAATTASTTFPFAPGSNFSSGIGYVSAHGQWQGSITYTFVNPTSVSRMLLWNAYFTFELDHSLKDAQLVFYNSANQVVGTENVSFPQAVNTVLTPQVVDLAEEVLDVKKVVITVQALWGGNEISLRRMAFAGNGLQSGIDDAVRQTLLPAYPMPAVDRATIPVEAARGIQLLDASGRLVGYTHQLFQDRVELNWTGVMPGIYYAHITTATGVVVSRILIAG